MKPSDEQVRRWAQESYEQWRAYSIGEAPRPALQREEYIAHKAYAAGRESMREEAAKVCDQQQAIDDRLTEGRYVPPSVCADAIRNLPTSEGDTP